MLLCSPVQLTTANTQVRAEVERVLLAQARSIWPEATIAVSVNIDPRLHLADCADLLVTPRGQQQAGRVHVAVRCGNPKAWSVYLPADVKVTTKVLVAARPLLRGQVLTADDTMETPMPISGHGMRLATRKTIQGLSPKRPIAEGAVLTLQLFAPVPAILRNDVVRLLSGSGSVRIETKGKALDGGQIGEQVMVENLTSGRRVAGWIVGPGVISTRREESL